MKLKKIKRMLAAALSTVIIGSSISAINAFATQPVYVDIVYDSVTMTYWANVKCNLTINAAGFHLKFGSGWDIVTKSNGLVNFKGNNDFNQYICLKGNDYEQEGLFVTIAGASDVECSNDTIISINIRKTSSYSPTNATANINIVDNDMFANSQERIIESSNSGTYISPMLRADEYIVGDADGDGRVTATDCSTVSAAVNNYGNMNVFSIRNTYKNYFPSAKAAAAADANQNGLISNNDASAILNYYATSGTGGTYNGNIGKIDIYDIY